MTDSCAWMSIPTFRPGRTWWSTGIGIRCITGKRPTGKVFLGHDLQPGRPYEEVTRTAQELRKIGPEIVDLHRKNQVAILYSLDSYYGIQFMKFSDRVDYRTLLWQMYGVLLPGQCRCGFCLSRKHGMSEYRLWWCRHCMWRVMHYWRGWWTT